jgi:hypothetical protein
VSDRSLIENQFVVGWYVSTQHSTMNDESRTGRRTHWPARSSRFELLDASSKLKLLLYR